MLFLLSADFFFSKLIFSKNNFKNAIGVSNSLEPDQDRQKVVPDLGPNCLQRLSADNKSHCWQGRSEQRYPALSAGMIGLIQHGFDR